MRAVQDNRAGAEFFVNEFILLDPPAAIRTPSLRSNGLRAECGGLSVERTKLLIHSTGGTFIASSPRQSRRGRIFYVLIKRKTVRTKTFTVSFCGTTRYDSFKCFTCL